MKTLLIPVDFSEICFTASRYAAGLATQLGSTEIILYHSFYEKVGLLDFHVDKEEIANQAATQITVLNDALRPLLPDNFKITLVINELPVKKGIRKILVKNTVSFIVMGLAGLQQLDKNEKAIGYHAREILSIREKPVLIIPRYAKYEPIKEVLFASDLLNVRKQTPVESLQKFITQVNASLEVIHVNIGKGALSEKQVAEQKKLEAFFDPLEVAIQVISDEEPAHGVLSFADKNNIQLIILAAKEHSFIESLFNHSVSKEVLKASPIPVFLMKD